MSGYTEKIYKKGLRYEGKIPKEYSLHLSIGDNVVIKSNTILAGEGFGYDKQLRHRPHLFGLIIQDKVHIGSNCTLDRGRWRDTIIGRNTKIDNQVHIAHNVQIGENCIIGPGVRVLGSVTIGNNCKIWTNAVIHQGVKIADNCVIGACSYLRHDTEEGNTYYGNPAILRHE